MWSLTLSLPFLLVGFLQSCSGSSNQLLSLSDYKALYNLTGIPIESFSTEKRPPCTTNDTRLHSLSGAANEQLRWRNGFSAQIDRRFSQQDANIIISGLDELQKKLCIKFKLHHPSANIPRGTDYTFYTRQQQRGCFSDIGRQGGRQILNLGERCVAKHIVMHETIHALGFNHEQCRPDRDEYITVMEDNIQEEMKFNYDIYQGSLTFNVPYDQQSLMHYHDTDFAKNEGEPTMIAKNGEPVGDIEQLRPSDIQKLRAMYRCK